MTKGNEMIQKGQFTHEMRIAASLLALPKKERPMMKEIAKEAGISERQLRNWKKEERFLQLIDQNVRNNVRGKMPDVLDALLDKAINDKSAKHIELVLKYQGVLKEQHTHEVLNVEQNRHDMSEFDSVDDDLTREIEELQALIDEAKANGNDLVIDAEFTEVDEK